MRLTTKEDVIIRLILKGYTPKQIITILKLYNQKL